MQEAKWYLRACPTCSGDCFESEPDWIECVACSRSFEKKEIVFRIMKARSEHLFDREPELVTRAS